MIYPSIDKLLNVVDSKYTLVTVAAERSRQISRTGHIQLAESEYQSEKPLGRALEEISENLIHIK